MLNARVQFIKCFARVDGDHNAN